LHIKLLACQWSRVPTKLTKRLQKFNILNYNKRDRPASKYKVYFLYNKSNYSLVLFVFTYDKLEDRRIDDELTFFVCLSVCLFVYLLDKTDRLQVAVVLFSN